MDASTISNVVAVAVAIVALAISWPPSGQILMAANTLRDPNGQRR
jgi:hypothetical protein